MLTAVRFLEVLVLGLWLGAIVFFSFVVAPAAFTVFPNRQVAGEFVGLVLARLYILSILWGAAFLLALLVEQRLTGESLRAVALPVGLVALLLLLALYSQYFLMPQMTALRTEMKARFGGVDQTPGEDAMRVQFNRYHRVSVWLMSASLLLVLTLLFLTVRRFT